MKNELNHQISITEEIKKLFYMSSNIRKENYQNAVKEFKFLYLKEDGRTFGFTNSQLELTHFPLETSLNKMKMGLGLALQTAEIETGILIKKFLKLEGINIPEDSEITIG